MENFTNPYAKLFYAVFKLHSQGQITDIDKLKLKGMIATGDQKIVSLLHHYLRDLNSEFLLQGIVKLVKPLRHKPEAIIAERTVVDEMSSPLGTFLHEKKKRQTAEHELKLSLQNTEITQIDETHEEELHHN